MKKSVCVVCALTLALMGTTLTQAATPQITAPAMRLAGSSSGYSTGTQKILWEHAGDLEAQTGSASNIGTAGMLSGYHNGYIIVGGGANFPKGSPAVNGPKTFYPDIYVLQDVNGQLRTVNHTTIGYEIGYGASVTADEGIYYIGGSPVQEEANNVVLVKADKQGKITVQKLADLPFTFSDGLAVKDGDTIYIGAGKQDGKASNRFYAYSIKTGETKELAPIPGPQTRTQCVGQVLGGNVCVFSGGDQIAYTDGYRYDAKTNTWTQLADVAVGGQGISLLGAGSVKLNEQEMLVIGGFNKAVYDNAVKQLGTLQGTELANFKNAYFSADSHTFNWNTNVLIYNASSNTWRTIGKIPFNAPCGEALVRVGNKLYSINGEIKPGTRVPSMYSGTIV